MWTCIIHPIHLHKRVCLFFQSVKPQLRKVRACSIETLRSHGFQEWTFIFLYLIAPTFNKRLIFRYFIYNCKCTHHSRILDWGGRGARVMDPPLTLALYFRLRSSWRFKFPGSDFTNRFINPFIMFAFHRSLKIRIIRTRNRTAFTRVTIRHIYPCLMYTRVTCKVTGSKSKRLWRMTREAAFRTVFP